MNFGNVTLNWFDILMVVVLIAGVLRGKKRGMSEELLDVLQWLAIVVVCALVYLPLGRFVADFTKMGLLWAFILSYLFTAVLLKLLFSAMKRAVGEKLMHADTFGRMEYYLGMVAGALRWFCMLLVCISLLHAKYIPPEEIARMRQVQAESFGAIAFPTIGSLQEDIFRGSYSGKLIRRYLAPQLILPTGAGENSMNDNIWRRRERQVNEVFN